MHARIFDNLENSLVQARQVLPLDDFLGYVRELAIWLPEDDLDALLDQLDRLAS